MAISFLRVEGFLADVVGAEFATQLGRSMYRGPNIHIPLLIAGFIIALYSRGLGFTWLALMIVVAELVIVITRFVFSYEQAFMGDLMRFWYAALFLFASAYTLLADGHCARRCLLHKLHYTPERHRQCHRVRAARYVGVLGHSDCRHVQPLPQSSTVR